MTASTWATLEATAAALVGMPQHRDLVASADGRRIAFTRVAGGDAELVTGHFDGNGFRLRSWPGWSAEPAGWLDDTRLLVSSDESGGRETHTLCILHTDDGTRTPLPQTGDAYCRFGAVHPAGDRFTITTTRAHGHQCPDPGAGSVWVVDAHSLRAQPLTCREEPTQGGIWSADGALLAVAQVSGADPASIVLTADGAQTVLTLSQAGPAFWHPRAPVLVTQGQHEGRLAAGLLDVRSSTHRVLGDHDHDEIPLCVDSAGRRLLCARLVDAEVRCVVYDLGTGAAVTVPAPAGVFTDPTRWLVGAPGAAFVDGADAFVANYASPVHPYRLVVVEPTSGALRPVREEDDPPQAPRHRPVHLTYPSRDGYPVPALLYLPPGPPRGGVVMLHGGPDWLWFQDFEPAAQLWVEAGLAVLLPNVRGSAGYGTAHRDAGIRDWGGVDLVDVLGASDLLVRKYGVPCERIGVYGASYGGYLAYLAALAQDSPFAAACVWGAPSDLRLLFEQAPPQYQALLRQMLGLPADRPDWWAQRSPVTHAARLRAPLLIVQGALDPRTPAAQADAMRAALSAAGKVEGRDFTVLMLDSGHHDTGYNERLFALRAVTTFFLHHLQT